MSIFTPDLFRFFVDLEQNNDRDWFAANKDRYEASVLGPCLAFIDAMRPALQEISPRFLAIAKKQGGSMFRIYRDTRFSKDKSPYKTHAGLQFRHEEASRDAHAPGFYLHLAPGDVMVGAGMWQPDSASLKRIRDAVVANPAEWTAIRETLGSKELSFMGTSLKRPPKGFDKEHPHVEDLKRKDWAVRGALDEARITSNEAIQHVARHFEASAPLMQFLCEAQGLAF